MSFVTEADIYKKRTKLTIVVKNEDSGVQNHINWFKASDLVQYTQYTTNTVLIWWAIYWVNEYIDPSNTSNRAYTHFTLDPSGNLKKLDLPNDIADSQTSYMVRTQGEDAGNIFKDSNLMKQVYIPVDSYGWLFNYELSEITSTTGYGIDPKNNPNVTTFEDITLVSYSAITSDTNWKPPVGSTDTGSTGSTGPAPPIQSGQNNLCKLPAGIMADRRQDTSRARYVQPDLSVANYPRVINAEDYPSDTIFYYKLSEVYNEMVVYDYLYYVKPIVPNNGLDKVYVRIDPNGNANAARSGAVLDPKVYPNISWGSKTFNIFTISQSNEWYIDNIYIPTTFYGTLFMEDYDYFKESNCYETFKAMTYKDISDIDNYKDFTNNQTSTNPPVVPPTDPVVIPPVDTSDPDDNIPVVDTSDPDDYGQNDTNDPIVIIDDNGNTIGDTTEENQEPKLGYSLRGKGGPAKEVIKKDINPVATSRASQMNSNLGLIAILLLAGIAIYSISNKSHDE